MITSSRLRPAEVMGSPVERTIILQDVFGISELRAPQAEAVDYIMEGFDVVVLFPTGYGKSVCYELPAMLKVPRSSSAR